MPLTHYRCPDGRECPVNECLKHCRLEGKLNPTTGMLYVPCGRCLSRRALLAIAIVTGKRSEERRVGKEC